ncbi:MAG: GNAT family N-acetyltransferase [Anaerolineaceae bacterium]|nr:MAG: GNAT family N-acetyltransferase [Anaerolineaceae bacterium]
MINVGNIREMDINDVNAVVKVHLSSFQGFFLTFLGRQFLNELYTSVVADSTGIAFVCSEEARVLGFVAGTSQPAGFYGRLLHRRWWRFVLSSLTPILKNPLIIPRLLRAIRKPQDVSNQPDTGTLMSIAVTPEAQGRGLGLALVKAFLEEAADRGLKHVDLTTDKNNNDSVNQFYRCMGFRCSRTFVTPEGREMNKYMIKL